MTHFAIHHRRQARRLSKRTRQVCRGQIKRCFFHLYRIATLPACRLTSVMNDVPTVGTASLEARIANIDDQRKHAVWRYTIEQIADFCSKEDLMHAEKGIRLALISSFPQAGLSDRKKRALCRGGREWRESGSYHLKLSGMARVRIIGQARKKPYESE